MTLAGALTVVAGCDGQQSAYPGREVPAAVLADGENAAAGRRLFLRHCATCHGRVEEGRSARAGFFEPPAPDFFERRYRRVDPAYLFWRISEGKRVEPFASRGSVMPAWGPHLSAGEIWQLVAYLRMRSEWKAD